MKAIFAAVVAFTFAVLIANANQLDESLRTIAGDITNKELTAKAAASAEASMETNALVNGTVDFLLASSDHLSEAAAVRFLLALKTFPFDELVARYKNSATSTERAYLLRVLDYGAKDERSIEGLKRLAADAIYDKGTGIKRYGEARAWSEEGERVCDVAYNILVSRLGLRATLPSVNVDNYSTAQCDEMIGKLCVQLKLPGPHATGAPTAVASGHGSLPSKAASAEDDNRPGGSGTISTLWLGVGLLIAAAIGLCWLSLKGRK